MNVNMILSLSPAESISIPQLPSTPSDPPPSDAPTKHHSLVGPIVGGVMGGIALIFIVILITLCLRNPRSEVEISHVDVFVEPPDHAAYNRFTFDPQTSNTILRMASRQELLSPPRISEKARNAAGPNLPLIHEMTPTSRDANQNIPVVAIQDSGRPDRPGILQGNSHSARSNPFGRELRGLRAELESLRRAVYSSREMDREQPPPSYRS